MDLGAFSLSLNVADVGVSAAFYKKLGFREIAGKAEDNWLVMTNDQCNIGLFTGMIDRNTLTFNPGWDARGQSVDPFEDIRDLQKTLKAEGIAFQSDVDETGTGRAHFVIHDPDGNPILVDQHR